MDWAHWPAIAYISAEVLLELYYATLIKRAFGPSVGTLIDWKGVWRVGAGCLAGKKVSTDFVHVVTPAAAPVSGLSLVLPNGVSLEFRGEPPIVIWFSGDVRSHQNRPLSVFWSDSLVLHTAAIIKSFEYQRIFSACQIITASKYGIRE